MNLSGAIGNVFGMYVNSISFLARFSLVTMMSYFITVFWLGQHSVFDTETGANYSPTCCMLATYRWFFRVLAIVCILFSLFTIFLLPSTPLPSKNEVVSSRWKVRVPVLQSQRYILTQFSEDGSSGRDHNGRKLDLFHFCALPRPYQWVGIT